MEYSKSNCKSSSTDNDSNMCHKEKEEFDMVVIAAPQTEDKSPIDFKGFNDKTVISNLTFPGRYHRTVATIVHGDLNPKYVGCDNVDCTTEVYFFVDPSHNINSIAKLVLIQYRPKFIRKYHLNNNHNSFDTLNKLCSF